MLKKSLSALTLATVLLAGAQVTASASDQTPRRLWQNDPTLSSQDGLSNYSSDYTDAAMLGRMVRSTYRVGQGAAVNATASLGAAGSTRAGASVALIDVAPDGLSNYGGDYTDAAMLGRPVRTTYRVGVGGTVHPEEIAGGLARAGGSEKRG